MRIAIFLSLAVLAPLSAGQAQPMDLKGFFARSCASCHGMDGSAVSPIGQRLAGRNLTDARWQAKQRDQELAATILKGKGAMPGFKALLSEQDAMRMITEVVRPFAAHKK